jgi:hypothetical protein
MAVTRLTLPADIKRRLERLARAAKQTPQAFMRDALAREVHRAELAAQGADEETGNTYELAVTFDYLTARVSGPQSRRPKGRPARASK